MFADEVHLAGLVCTGSQETGFRQELDLHGQQVAEDA